MKKTILFLSLVPLLFITSSQAANSDLIQTHWNGSAYAENAQLQSGWAEAFFFNRYRFKGNEKVLDIGSGDGKLSAKIATAVSKGSVLGIDKSNSMIEEANKNHSAISNLRFELIDAQNAEFYQKYPEKFDLVVSFVTLHWVKDQLTVLKGIHQVLKPKGEFYLKLSSKGGDPIQDIADALSKQQKYQAYFNEFVDPMTRFSESDYQTLLKQAHLHLVSISDHEEKDKVQNKVLLTKQIKSWLPHYHYLKLNHPKMAEQYINAVINAYLLKFPADQKGEITLYDHYLEVVGKKDDIS